MIIVLFRTRTRPEAAGPEYEATAQRMMELVAQVPGYLSFDWFTSPDGEELSIARFESEKALEQWRNHPEHVKAQQQGKATFFESYQIQVCSLIREYGFTRPSSAA